MRGLVADRRRHKRMEITAALQDEYFPLSPNIISILNEARHVERINASANCLHEDLLIPYCSPVKCSTVNARPWTAHVYSISNCHIRSRIVTTRH
jgi:hypothetical protein